MAAPAWVARIDQIADDGAGHIQVSVTYWAAADTTFQNRLGGYTSSYGAGWSLADIGNDIVNQGAAIRAAQLLSANLQSHIGQTLPIP